MKPTWMLILFSIMVFQACESTEDTLETLDHSVPSVEFNPDTLEVNAGETVTLNAEISDESGIQRIEFSYGDWRINEIIDLSLEDFPSSYTFSTQITVPADALKEWEESKYFNDGTSVLITQQHHKLSLSTWDKNRNLRKGYVFVKVK